MTHALARRSRPPLSLADRVRWAFRSFWTGPLLSSDPAIARLFSDGAGGASGIAVTPRNAFTFSAVYDAINQQSSDVAKLPLKLKKRRADGGTDDYQASKLYELMTYAPNPETDPMVFRRTINAHAMTWHGGFAEIERNGLGEPIALWILTPDRVEPFRARAANGTYGRLQYRIDGSAILEARDVLHIQGLGYDGTQAYPLITLARQAIGLALAAETFGSTVFRQGRYGGVLSTEDDLDPDQQTVVKGDIQKMRAGYEQFLVLFGQKWQYTRTAIASSEAELSKTREQQIEEVARFFNHPLYKLKHPVPGSQSYASNEMADLDYYKGPILNWVTLWEQQLNRKLISPLERKQQFFKHNVNAFLRGDIKSRYDALGIARDKGIINADEWRELEDMNPQDGGQGKLYLVQQAQVPLNKIDALIASQIEKNTPAPAPPAPTQQEVEAANARAVRAEALAEEARADLAAAQAQLTAVEASGAAAIEELAARRAEVAGLTSRSIELEVIAAWVREQSGVLQRDLEARTDLLTQITADRDRLRRETIDADRDRHSAVLSALRGLMIDIMRRMVDRETERARRSQTTPEKFRTFLGTFYSGHQELCETALLPAVRVHLAYTRSTDDPVAVTRRLVTQHIEESLRQLHAVLDGEADELGVSLGALLRRWESERVEVLPDYLLKRGLDYAARHSS